MGSRAERSVRQRKTGRQQSTGDSEGGRRRVAQTTSATCNASDATINNNQREGEAAGGDEREVGGVRREGYQNPCSEATMRI